MHKKSKAFNAFTLAEVLITLAIIGIVAAIVIPILVNKSQEMSFHSALKKAYSDFSQATNQLVQDNNGSLVGVCTDVFISQCAKDWYAKYLSVLKKCLNGTVEGCWHKAGDIHALNNSDDGGWLSMDSSALILKNGMLVRFMNYSSGCTYNFGGHPICTLINIDINGFKGPNIVGKDVYEFELLKDKLMPVGGSYDSWMYSAPNSYGCFPSSDGTGCAAYYLYNN